MRSKVSFWWLVFPLFFCECFAFSSDAPPLLGHNFTPTSNVLKKGQVSVGTYAVAVGLSDAITLATSPWLLVNYNMPSAILRVGGPLLDDKLAGALEISYFKTFPIFFNLYRQESFYLRGVLTQKLSSRYSIHTGLSAQYFIDDNVPFSLRLYHDASLFNITLSSLHEIRLWSSGGMFLEAGVSGLNYWVAHWLFGASVFFAPADGWLVQLGASLTNPVKTAGPDKLRLGRFMIHPEMQIQVSL